jgi:hypothetical protein
VAVPKTPLTSTSYHRNIWVLDLKGGKPLDKQKEKIIDLIEYISSKKRKLKLITNFRGVPIQIDAGIIRCASNTGNVRLGVHRWQIAPLKTAQTIFIESDLFPNLLIAEIEQLDLDKGIVTLRGLRYVIGSMGDRKNIRVEPENRIHTELILGYGYRLKAEVADISLNGLSINLAKDDFPQDGLFMLQIPVEIRLGLPVPGESAIHDINVQGVIAYMNESQQSYRVGLLTFLKEPDLGFVRRYIFDRQTDILNEIQNLNSAILEMV